MEHMEYMETLSLSGLFSAIDPRELSGLLNCIQARYVKYKKDDFVIEKGSTVSEFGLILTGQCCSLKWDASGRRVILTFIEKGMLIGLMIAAKEGHSSPVSVQATEDSYIMLIPFARIISPCSKDCHRHRRLLTNYISALAEKGLELHERINCLLEPSVRDKIMTYLSRISKEQESRTFAIPINRNAMAEYLNIERSALSRALSGMKKDGLIDYHKNLFKLRG